MVVPELVDIHPIAQAMGFFLHPASILSITCADVGKRDVS